MADGAHRGALRGQQADGGRTKKLSRALDAALERSGGAGYPEGLEHYAIAETFGCSPADVLDWDIDMVEDAIQIMRARARYAERTKGRR